MALNNLGLGFVFTARDLASGTIRRVGASLGVMDRNAMRSAAAYQRNFAVMGAGLAIMGAGAATLAGAFSLAHQAAEFEQELARVGAVAQASSEQLEQLHTAAIRAGIATQFSPTEAVQGLGVLAQQGFNTAQSIRLLEPTLDLAAGGMITVEQAAASVTSAVHVFGLSMDEATTVADQLLRITNRTALGAGDLEVALGTVARGARLTHQSLEEMLPAIGLLRNTGLEASTAAQSVSSALTFMSARAEAIQQTLGVTLTETLADGTQAFRPFMDIALEAGTALEERFANPAERTAAAVELFSRFGVGAVTGVFDSLRSGVTDSEGHIYRGADAIAFLRSQMTEADGAAAEFRARLLDTFAGQQTLLTGSMQTLGVVVGEGFTRGLRPFVEGAINLVNGLIEIFDRIPLEVRGAIGSAIIALGGLLTGLGAIVATGAAIALIAPFVSAIATAVGGLIVAMSPFLAMGAAVWGLIRIFAVFERQHLGFSAAVNRSWEMVSLGFRSLIQLFTTGELSGAIAQEMSQVENSGLLSFVVDLYAIGFRVQQFFRGISLGFDGAMETLGPSVDRMLEAFTELGRALGFMGEEGREAIAGMPSSEFMSTGAQIGAFLAGVVEVGVQAITMMSDLTLGILDGWKEISTFLAPIFAALIPAVAMLGSEFMKLLVDVGAVSGEGADATATWREFGSFIGGALGTGIAFLSASLEAVILVLTGIVWGVRQVIGVFNAMRNLATRLGIELTRAFIAIADGIQNAIDRMITGVASVIALIPASARGEEFDSFMTSASAAGARIKARPAQALERDAAARVLQADAESSPAAAAAASQARSDARGEAAMARVARILEAQRSGDDGMMQVSVQVSGEEILRSTQRAERAERAASFEPVMSEE